MRQFELYARLRAAQKEAGKDAFRARGVLLMVLLEVGSLLSFVQIALLTHGIFLAIPAVLLLANAAIRLGQKSSLLMAEPLYAFWPAFYSGLGLCRKQRAAGLFCISLACLQMALCASFWLDANSLGLLQDFDGAYCHPDLRVETCAIGQNCFTVSDSRSSPKQRIGLLSFKRISQSGGSCHQTCKGCLPSTYTRDAIDGLGRVTDFVLTCSDDCHQKCCRCMTCLATPSLSQHWLRQSCADGAFEPSLPSHSFWQSTHLRTGPYDLYVAKFSWASENAFSLVLSRCALAQKAHDGWGTALRAWFATATVLLIAPAVCVIGKLLLSVGLADRLGGILAVPKNEATLDAIEMEKDHSLAQLRRSNAEADPWDRVNLHKTFALFVLDYLSDWATLVTHILAQQWGLAAAQAAIIAAPMCVDCFKGKVQLVEVLHEYGRSRRKGVPTNGFLMALRSEKGAEAPLSFLLTYYSIFRTTSLRSFCTMLASLILSMLSISVHVYATFELGLAYAEDSQAPSSQAASEPENTQPPSRIGLPPEPLRAHGPGQVPQESNRGPALPPGLAPPPDFPRAGQGQGPQVMNPHPASPSGRATRPGVLHFSSTLPPAPITVEGQRPRDKE